MRHRRLSAALLAAMCSLLIASCAMGPEGPARNLVAGTTLTINGSCVACHADRTSDRHELRLLCTANN